ncbi:MAG: hypothetical protein SX243_09870 [Acidobacteriota bacterium]|nr:hypothetical protein [Acidobacteriota bacterium]
MIRPMFHRMSRPMQLRWSVGPALRTAALLCVLLLPTAASAQEGAAQEGKVLDTVEEVLACHYQAHGGDAWKQLQSLQLEGSYSAFSTPSTFKLYRQRPDHYRFETTLLDVFTSEGFDGTDVWLLFPLLGPSWPIPAPPAEAVRIQGQLEFDGPLVDSAAKGHTVQLAEVTDFEGTPSYQLEVQTAHGTEETWYLAVETCLEVGRDFPTADFGRGMRGRAFYSDFRPVAGVLLPHRIEEEYGIRYRITEIQKIVANPQLDPQIFAYRPLPEMESLAWLEGSWQVQMESRPAERAPWSSATIPTTVASEFHGTLLRHRMDRFDGTFEHGEERTLTYDRFRESYVLTVFDQLTNHSQRLVGKLEDGVLTLSDQETDSAAIFGGFPTYTRLVFRDLSPEGFVIERHQSSDEGETWALLGRETFTRSGK